MQLDPAACRGYAKLIRKDAQRSGWDDVATPQAWHEIADLLDAAADMADSLATAQASMEREAQRQAQDGPREQSIAVLSREERCPKCGGELRPHYQSAARSRCLPLAPYEEVEPPFSGLNAKEHLLWRCVGCGYGERRPCLDAPKGDPDA